MFLHLLSRNPSSSWETCGPGSQQLGGDGPLAATGFIRPLCCQQLHCGVQTGGYVWQQLECHLKRAKCPSVVFSVAVRLVAVAAGGQQQRGVCSD